jgi:ribose 5-phosphate isomerase B
MKISVGADHAGFRLKERLKRELLDKGHEVLDKGTASEESTDYPDYARAVADDVVAGFAERGILFCSSGVGMSIAANKVKGIRAALGTNAEEVALTRSHNDANILTLGAKFIAPDEAGKLIDVFLSTNFEGGRHARRIGKIQTIEETQ